MDRVARLALSDRSDLFRAAADVKKVGVQIIEKDFWVCWVLRHLYSLNGLPAPLYFKGGTSLSKAFGIIDRMSEDIDLVIDRHALGFTGDRDPSVKGLTKKARERLIRELKSAAADFVGVELGPALVARFTEILGGSEGWSIRVDVSNLDNTVIEFSYPTGDALSAYLKPMVQLELGARGDTWPAVERTVQPYAADSFPDQFDAPSHAVTVITAERTFWEKATLLHVLAQYDPVKAAERRPARHFYDLFRLLQHDSGQRAIKDLRLLADVVHHKETFYPRAADRYDLAVPATLRLVPDDTAVRLIEPEYTQMAEEMIFGEAPPFSEVLQTLRRAEAELRAGV